MAFRRCFLWHHHPAVLLFLPKKNLPGRSVIRHPLSVCPSEEKQSFRVKHLQSKPEMLSKKPDVTEVSTCLSDLRPNR
jgi:hypothetical protein